MAGLNRGGGFVMCIDVKNMLLTVVLGVVVLYIVVYLLCLFLSSKVNIGSTSYPVSSLPTDNKSVYDLFYIMK